MELWKCEGGCPLHFVRFFSLLGFSYFGFYFVSDSLLLCCDGGFARWEQVKLLGPTWARPQDKGQASSSLPTFRFLLCVSAHSSSESQ